MRQLIILTVAALVLAGASPERSALAPSPATTALDPVCQLSTTSLDFGCVPFGGNANTTFTVMNTGNMSFTITGFSSTNPAFSITTSLPVSLNPGSTRTLTVSLSCASGGLQTGTITLMDNRGGICSPINVSGTCGTAQCMVSPTSLSFGTTVCAGSFDELTFTVSNTGQIPLTLTAITPSDPAFSITSPSLPATIPAGNSTMVTVRLTCSSSGSKSGTINLTATSACGPVSCSPVSVSGFCSVYACAVSPTSLSFGNVCVGTSADRSFTVSNTGNQLFTIGVESSNPAFTVVSPALPAMVPAGGSVTVMIRLSCTSPGSQSGTINIEVAEFDDNPCVTNDCSTVTVNGTCVVQDINVSPTSLTFGNQCINTTSATQTVTVSTPVLVRSSSPATPTRTRPTFSFNLFVALPWDQVKIAPIKSNSIRRPWERNPAP